ncbi:MAG TPA: glycosyl hydrolase family 18 protein [Gemmatimonadaceae bacterium]|nr:glycosyl hydrolase family 18 protein [Gemmatimonadaceae bacterium]
MTPHFLSTTIQRELTMQRTIALLITILLAPPALAKSQQPGGERLFYITNSPDAISSFERNARSVSIVGPQSYRVDAEGNLTGEVPISILAIAKTNKVPVMPLIVNPGWNIELFHKLVNNHEARAIMIASMVSLGKKNGFWGWQFDFEQIHVTDRDSLSRFYREAADALHANGMKVSIAVYPDPGDLQNASEYHTWLWTYLVGAYDLKALADAGDFVTVMTYLQHTPRTPPGPVGGLPYMERVIRTALALGVKPHQLSLGIAFYSMHWRTEWNAERKGYSWGRGLSWNAAIDLVQKAGVRLRWDAVEGASEARWEQHGVFEYAWIEDAAALAPKLALQKRYGLRGISVWRIGQEDQRVWKQF